jgi:hypothetical protein
MSSGYETGRFANVGDLSQVSSHTDVAQVAERMLTDLRDHPAEWENPTLERFLDALAASLEGCLACTPTAPSASRNLRPGRSSPKHSSWPAATSSHIKLAPDTGIMRQDARNMASDGMKFT